MLNLKINLATAIAVTFATFIALSASSVMATELKGPGAAGVQLADEKPTIKTIMQVAHKDGLLKKVATNKATAEERKLLLKHYQELAKLKPARGPEDSWKEKTGLMIKAAQAAVESDPKASNKLKMSTNCSACHDVHK